MPHPLSQLCFNFTLQCVQNFFHMVNINVPAGVGTPPLDTQLGLLGKHRNVPDQLVAVLSILDTVRITWLEFNWDI